jgi:hypothetical protein
MRRSQLSSHLSTLPIGSLKRPGLTLSDEEIATELTQVVAIAAAGRFVALTHRPLMEREIHSAKFLLQRLPIMNERDCDYEDNGIRAWFIARNRR